MDERTVSPARGAFLAVVGSASCDEQVAALAEAADYASVENMRKMEQENAGKLTANARLKPADADTLDDLRSELVEQRLGRGRVQRDPIPHIHGVQYPTRPLFWWGAHCSAQRRGDLRGKRCTDLP